MKTQLAITAAAAIALLLSAGPIAAADSHWSAAIGTGHSSESATNDGNTSRGVPASPHWAAAIGTGNVTQNASPAVSVSAQPQQSVAKAHWASKIGTGHASESSARATKETSTVVASVRERAE